MPDRSVVFPTIHVLGRLRKELELIRPSFPRFSRIGMNRAFHAACLPANGIFGALRQARTALLPVVMPGLTVRPYLRHSSIVAIARIAGIPTTTKSTCTKSIAFMRQASLSGGVQASAEGAKLQSASRRTGKP